MEVSTAAIELPKQGNETIGSDDAFASSCEGPSLVLRPGEVMRFAIADGASGSIYSGQWAQILARSFVRGDLCGEVSQWPFAWMANEWRESAKSRLASAYGDAIPWYLLEKLDASAHAALLGVKLEWPENSRRPTITAWAIGDACFAHVRSDGFRLAFPIEDPEAFGNDPVLIPAEQDAGTMLPDAKCDGADIYDGDRLYMLTDAVAAWFLRERVAGGKPWLQLDEVLDARCESAAKVWADGERDAGRMKNDDITVLRLRFGPG